ncbi:hypothetical protein QVD99_005445 [Batrachochytrium dendrobatidis]|nr:hypothetical protein QVD99_005445 [Batrachochytrium dendrobatidis]
MQDYVDLQSVQNTFGLGENDVSLSTEFRCAFYVHAPVRKGSMASRHEPNAAAVKSRTLHSTKPSTTHVRKATSLKDIGLQQSISACAAWFVRYGPNHLQVSTVVGSKHILLASLSVEQLSDGDSNTLEISLVTHVRLGLLEFLLIAVKDTRSRDTTLWLFEPFSLHTLKVPFEFDSSVQFTALGSTNAEIVDSQCCSYIVVGSVARFFVGTIVPMSPPGVQVDTFGKLLTTHLTGPLNATVTAISTFSSSTHDAPLFIIGTSNGGVEIWAMKTEETMELVYTIKSACFSPIEHICFDKFSIGLEPQYILYVSNELNVADVKSGHSITSIFSINSNFNSTKRITPTQLVTNARVAAIKFGRGVNGEGCKLFTVYLQESLFHLQIHKLSEDAIHLIVEETLATGKYGTIQDIEPLGSTSNCMILSLDKVGKFVGDHNPPSEREHDYPHYSDWLSRDPKRFPYSRETSQAILTHRCKMDNELFIDKLLSLFGINGPAVYPPSDAAELELLFDDVLSCANMALMPKHCVIFYLLLDCGTIASEYACMWGITQPFLTSIRGYWAMDHGQFETGSLLLSDPSIELDWAPKILKTLVGYQQFTLAYQFIQRVRSSIWSMTDVELQMEILVNTHFDEAMSFQRKYAPALQNQRLFAYLIEHTFSTSPNASEYRKRLLDITLLPDEESCVISQCRSRASALYVDFLIAYYLNRSRYSEAIHIYDEFFGSSSALQDEKSAARCAMIDNVRLVVSQVQRASLAISRETSHHMPRLLSETTKPLSLMIATSNAAEPVESHTIAASSMSNDVSIQKASLTVATPVPTPIAAKSSPLERMQSTPFKNSPSCNSVLRALHENHLQNSETAIQSAPTMADWQPAEPDFNTTKDSFSMILNTSDSSDSTPLAISDSLIASVRSTQSNHVFAIPQSIDRSTPLPTDRSTPILTGRSSIDRSTPVMIHQTRSEIMPYSPKPSPPFTRPPISPRNASTSCASLTSPQYQLSNPSLKSQTYSSPVIVGTQPATVLTTDSVYEVDGSFVPSLPDTHVRTPVQMEQRVGTFEDRSSLSGMRPARVISSPRGTPVGSSDVKLTNNSPFSQPDMQHSTHMHLVSPAIMATIRKESPLHANVTPVSVRRSKRLPMAAHSQSNLNLNQFASEANSGVNVHGEGKHQDAVASLRKSARKQSKKTGVDLLSYKTNTPSSGSTRLQRKVVSGLLEDEENIPDASQVESSRSTTTTRRTPKRTVSRSNDVASVLPTTLLSDVVSDADIHESAPRGRTTRARAVAASTPISASTLISTPKKTTQFVRTLRAPPKQLRNDIMMLDNIPAMPDSLSDSRHKQSTLPAELSDDTNANMGKSKPERRQTPRKVKKAGIPLNENSETSTPQRTVVTRRMASRG